MHVAVVVTKKILYRNLNNLKKKIKKSEAFVCIGRDLLKHV